jgi:monofunctional biosynthetic peptidoglycan transglycosylase
LSEADPAAERDGRVATHAGEVAKVLVDFDDPADCLAWRPVDDVVMGGVSHSRLEPAQPGIARFAGEVSLDYGGGFASVRTEPRDWETAAATALVLRCRGDGRTYKFTVRSDDRHDGVQFQARFTPDRDRWTTVRLPIAALAATFRGRRVADADPLRPGQIRRLGLMVSDRQAGPFELLVDWIGVASG